MTYELPFGKGRKLMNHGGVSERGSRRMGSRVYADLAVGTAVHGVASRGARITICPAQSRPNLVPGVDPVDAGLGHRAEPFPDAGAGPVSECRRVRLSGSIHRRDDGAQRGGSSRADLAAVLAVEAMELLRAGANSFFGGI